MHVISTEGPQGRSGEIPVFRLTRPATPLGCPIHRSLIAMGGRVNKPHQATLLHPGPSETSWRILGVVPEMSNSAKEIYRC